MAIDLGKKDIYLYDLSNNEWTKWQETPTGARFLPAPAPVLGNNYTGIGSREMTPEGEAAILALYEKPKKEVPKASGFTTEIPEGEGFDEEISREELDPELKRLQEEEAETKIGTTKRGNGPAYRDKYYRTGVQARQVPVLKDYLIDWGWKLSLCVLST